MSRTGNSARGSGSIKKVSRQKGGKTYTYWQAKYTEGYNPGTGRQIQKTIYGKTQKEVAQRLRKITSELDEGTYREPCKLLISEWLDIWLKDYTAAVKPRTVDSYRTTVNVHLKPAFGATRLDELKTPMIQNFYNGLQVPGKLHRGLSAKDSQEYTWSAPQGFTAGSGAWIYKSKSRQCL